MTELAAAASQPEALEQRPLFGGAMQISMPARMVDVSDFRPVPDHQEVFADGSTDQSLIVEVVEHRDDVSDEAAGSFLFQDLADVSEASSSQLESVSLLGSSDMPGVPSDAFKCLVHGRQAVAKGRQGPEAANSVQVQLAAVRLPQHGSDILLILNSPEVISGASTVAADVGAGQQTAHLAAPQLFREMLGSLRVVDWGLFGGEDATAEPAGAGD